MKPLTLITYIVLLVLLYVDMHSPTFWRSLAHCCFILGFLFAWEFLAIYRNRRQQ